MQMHAKQKVHNFNRTHIVFSQKARQRESATFRQKGWKTSRTYTKKKERRNNHFVANDIFAAFSLIVNAEKGSCILHWLRAQRRLQSKLQMGEMPMRSFSCWCSFANIHTCTRKQTLGGRGWKKAKKNRMQGGTTNRAFHKAQSMPSSQGKPQQHTSLSISTVPSNKETFQHVKDRGQWTSQTVSLGEREREREGGREKWNERKYPGFKIGAKCAFYMSPYSEIIDSSGGQNMEAGPDTTIWSKRRAPSGRLMEQRKETGKRKCIRFSLRCPERCLFWEQNSQNVDLTALHRLRLRVQWQTSLFPNGFETKTST